MRSYESFKSDRLWIIYSYAHLRLQLLSAVEFVIHNHGGIASTARYTDDDIHVEYHIRRQLIPLLPILRELVEVDKNNAPV